jgi:hypothetical protein
MSVTDASSANPNGFVSPTRSTSGTSKSSSLSSLSKNNGNKNEEEEEEDDNDDNKAKMIEEGTLDPNKDPHMDGVTGEHVAAEEGRCSLRYACNALMCRPATQGMHPLSSVGLSVGLGRSVSQSVGRLVLLLSRSFEPTAEVEVDNIVDLSVCVVCHVQCRLVV